MLYPFWYKKQKNISMKLCCLRKKNLPKTLEFYNHRGTLNKTLCKLLPFLILTLEIDM